jgi:hypothetical protein
MHRAHLGYDVGDPTRLHTGRGLVGRRRGARLSGQRRPGAGCLPGGQAHRSYHISKPCQASREAALSRLSPTTAGRPPKDAPNNANECGDRRRQRCSKTQAMGHPATPAGLYRPTARSAGCNPAVPLLTAHACSAPTRAANMRSNSPTRAPKESCPERNTSNTASSSAAPIQAWRAEQGRQRQRHRGDLQVLGGATSGRTVPSPMQHPSPALGTSGRTERRNRRGLATLHSKLQRIHQSIPRSSNKVLGNPNRAQTSRPSEASIKTRVTAPVPLFSSGQKSASRAGRMRMSALLG